MIVFDLVGDNEHHPVYQSLTIDNGIRQYDFLRSIVGASVSLGRPFLSSQVLKALNYHAIACMHSHAGEYRPCQVWINRPAPLPPYEPPAWHRVQALMDEFVNFVNRVWAESDPVGLAAFVLWRLNWIHPFVNGNGRTARAACYFVLCVHARQWLPGTTILPELIKRERVRYELGLQHADATYLANGQADLSPLHQLLQDLVNEQLNGNPPAAAPTTPVQPPSP